MPQKRNSAEPPKVMTWGKAAPILAVCVIFDALRLMFEMFWFFGPAMAALYCTVKVSGVVGTTLGGFACGVGATVAGTLGAPAIEVFGVVMAIAVGLFGWLVIGLWLMVTNARIFKENAAWFAGSLLISEIPIVGSIPALTIIVWKMYRTQITLEKAEMQRYEQERAAAERQEREQRIALVLHNQSLQQAQIEQEEAADDALSAEAANDDEYIPQKMREAA